jgi:cytochrome b involved in lipid metabolism
MKRLMGSALLLTAAAAHAQTASYTLADVAAHATAADCWMILNTNKVYDFSSFISMHPGGKAMVPYCGKDGTAAFTNLPHSANAASMEAAYLIGDLVAAPAAVSVTLSPSNASLSVGGTVQFTPKVANSTEGVAWTVQPSTLGTISASGMFTALAAGQGTVTAASVQDNTKSASAVITVNSTPTGGGAHNIAVSVNPSAMTVNVGAKARFRAQVSNSSQGVTWKVSGSIGTIDASGVLTAALTPATGSVTATSVEDPTKSASVQVTLTAVNCAPGRPGKETRHHDDD